MHTEQGFEVELPDDAMLAVASLATSFDVDPEALRKRLERWRARNAAGNDWMPNENRGPNDPAYIYRVGAVRSIVLDLKSRG